MSQKIQMYVAAKSMEEKNRVEELAAAPRDGNHIFDHLNGNSPTEKNDDIHSVVKCC